MNFFQQRLSLVLANILIPVAVLVFGAGLFRQASPSLETGHDELLQVFNNGDQGFSTEKEAPFDKIVFMVIDALRRFYSFIPLFLFFFPLRVRAGVCLVLG